MKKILFLAVLAVVPSLFAARLTIIPKGKFDFKAGEKVTFVVTAYDDDDKLLTEGRFRLAFHKSGGEQLRKIERVNLAKKGNPFEVTASMDEPGFILVRATELVKPDNTKVKWDVKSPANFLGGAAVEPEKIRAVNPVPEDFDKFWQDTLKSFKNAKVLISPAPDIKRDNYKVSRIQIPFPDGSGAIYGFLSIPEGGGKFPAIVGVPGAGRGSISPVPYWVPGKKAISLWFNVLPYPAAKKERIQSKLYEEYTNSLNARYSYTRYFYYKAEDKNSYFYRNIWAAVSRGIDYVATLPEFDGKNFAAAGNSQGGGTALVLGGLNNNISCVVASVPAFCDHGGWKVGRKSGWPDLHGALKVPLMQVPPILTHRLLPPESKCRLLFPSDISTRPVLRYLFLLLLTI